MPIDKKVMEFQILVMVKFADGTERAVKSPLYHSQTIGLGPDLLTGIISSHLREWLPKLFDT